MTTDGVKARIGGFPILNSATVSWTLAAGVRPYEGTFDLRPGDAETLVAGRARPIELEIDDGNGRTVKIEYLYALAMERQDDPFIARVLVVDRRWFWSFRHVSRAFNVRRIVGNRRQRVVDTPPELQPLAPEVAYHPATLRNGETWKAEEILENVLANALDAEGQAVGERADFAIDPSIGKRLDNLPIEDLEVEESADRALARVMAYLPEAAVRVEANGFVRVYSRADASDRQLVEELAPEMVGYGHVSWLSNARLRPSKIHVLFTREHEVRFDFLETGRPTVTEDERYVENVVQVPDYSLTLSSGNSVAEGTWISLVEALNAWGAPPNMAQLATADGWLVALRRYMCPYLDLWTGVGLNGVQDPNAVWMARIGAMQQHYRRTFRINPRWMARIAQLKATKIATIDPATGSRAPALVYADYCRLATMRSKWKDKLAGQDAVFGMNVKSYPKSNQLADGVAAPANLSIADQDQGILHIDFIPDPFLLHEATLPGMLSLEGSGTGGSGRPTDAGPTWDIEDTTRPITFNAISEEHRAPELVAEHRTAIVMTAIPATWNSSRNLHLFRITKEPSDVTQLLPSALASNLLAAYGPELEIRIGANIETARVAWLDNRSADIETAFGVVDGPVQIDDLIVNLDGDQDGASLDSIATAVAARTWAALTDRYQGERGVALAPNAEPTGFIDQVSHDVTSAGAVMTRLRLPERLAEIDLFSLLPDSTRRMVLRLAPSPGKGGAG